MARAVVPLVVFVSCAALLLPIGLGAARQQVPSWWAPGQNNVVVLQQTSGRHCVAMEGGELCGPLWSAPVFVASWYWQQLFG